MTDFELPPRWTDASTDIYVEVANRLASQRFMDAPAIVLSALSFQALLLYRISGADRERILSLVERVLAQDLAAASKEES